MDQHVQAPWDSSTQAQPKAPFSALAILGFIFAFLLSPLGLVFSILALFDARKYSKRGKGLAIAGIIISIINSIIGIILGIIVMNNVSQTLGQMNALGTIGSTLTPMV